MCIIRIVAQYLLDMDNLWTHVPSKAALPGQLYPRLQPNLAEFFCSTFTHMDMGSALIKICIVEQKVPYDFGRDV